MEINKSRGGFTLIELMVVITVISILATMSLYGLNKAQQAARDAARQQIMTGMQTALERYYGDKQEYPQVWSGGVNYGWANMLWTICTHQSYNPGTVCGAVTGGANPDPTPYLTVTPSDPLKSCTNGGIPPGGPWYPCGNTNSTPPAYYYEPSGTNHPGYANSPCSSGVAFPQAYQFALIKESGGIVYYCSPN